MTNYDPNLVLQGMNDNIALVLTGLAFAGILTFVYFYEAIRIGFQEKTYSPPLAATLWFLAHDFVYVLHYDLWFNVYPHWWTKAWFYGLIATTFIEIFILWQTIKYGREELMPGFSQKVFAWTLSGAAVAVIIIWAVVKNALDDDLYICSALWTILWPNLFMTGQILNRRSRKGSSMLQQIALIPMYMGFWLALYVSDPFFQSPYYIALAGVMVCWCLFNMALWRRQPA